MITESISIATVTDITALMALENICFTTDKLTAAQYKRFITKTPAFLAIYKKDNQVQGSILILFRKHSKRARLYSLAVHPDYQGQGIAKKLCEFAYTFLIEHQYEQLDLEVRKDNERAIQFYRQQQFKPIGEYLHFYEDGEDALRMSKKIILF